MQNSGDGVAGQCSWYMKRSAECFSLDQWVALFCEMNPTFEH